MLRWNLRLTLLWVAATCLVYSEGFAQPQGLEFEVATIKPSAASVFPVTTLPRLRDGRVDGKNLSLKTLLALAYEVSDFQITGPNWLSTNRYDIAATVPDGTVQSQVAQMLRTLITERFQIVTHSESVQTNVFAMTVEESGPKFRRLEQGERIRPVIPPKAAVIMVNGDMRTWGEWLTRVVGRPVIDQTGLVGSFGLSVIYDNGDGKSDLPEIFAAVQEQLGLKLTPRRMPVTMLVVDQADRVPAEN